MKYERFTKIFSPGPSLSPNRPQSSWGERAQSIVIIAVAFVALLAIVGLVTDAGSIYVSWTRLKRAVDAASVAAANNMKSAKENITNAERLENMERAAREMLALNGIEDVDIMQILTCEDAFENGNPVAGSPADLLEMCPTATGYRKLAWIQAREPVNVYFLTLVGIRSYPLTLSSIGEAAMLDLVLVFDTSESMGVDTHVPDSTNYTLPTVGDDPAYGKEFNPAHCTQNHKCFPLEGAKDAAKSLINRLYAYYDRVAIVTFDYQAKQVFPPPPGGQDFTAPGLKLNGTMVIPGETHNAIDSITSEIVLHDDADLVRLAWDQYYCRNCVGKYNPVFPEDRDGDGLDADVGNCTPTDDLAFPYRVDADALAAAEAAGTIDAFLNDPVLCDLDDQFDVFDWNDPPDGDYENDHAKGLQLWNEGRYDRFTSASTCIGCGIRMGRQILAEYGRPGGVWVMVVLTDGAANASDNAYTWPVGSNGEGIPNDFPYGFCTRYQVDDNPIYWGYEFPCKDFTYHPRFCLDSDSSDCPPSAIHTTAFWDPAGESEGYVTPYSGMDYALDMTDAAALLYPELQEDPNPDEPNGEDIVMYSITFGEDAAALQLGLGLMHYIADVGDDGARGGECAELGTSNFTTQCGNYYYAANGAALSRVFSDIMARIYTKISQ